MQVSIRKVIKGRQSYVEVADYKTGLLDQRLVEVSDNPKVEDEMGYHIEDIVEAIRTLGAQADRTVVLPRRYIDALTKRGHEFTSKELLTAEDVKDKPFYHSFSIIEREKAPAVVKPKVVTADDGKVELVKAAAPKGKSKAAVAREVFSEMLGKPEAEVIAAIASKAELTVQLARVYYKGCKKLKPARKVKKNKKVKK